MFLKYCTNPCERYRFLKTVFFKGKLKHLRDRGVFGIEVQNQGAPKLILILFIFTVEKDIGFIQGSLNYPFGGDQTIQMYGNFDEFLYN